MVPTIGTIFDPPFSLDTTWKLNSAVSMKYAIVLIPAARCQDENTGKRLWSSSNNLQTTRRSYSSSWRMPRLRDSYKRSGRYIHTLSCWKESSARFSTSHPMGHSRELVPYVHKKGHSEESSCVLLGRRMFWTHFRSDWNPQNYANLWISWWAKCNNKSVRFANRKLIFGKPPRLDVEPLLLMGEPPPLQFKPLLTSLWASTISRWASLNKGEACPWSGSASLTTGWAPTTTERTLKINNCNCKKLNSEHLQNCLDSCDSQKTKFECPFLSQHIANYSLVLKCELLQFFRSWSQNVPLWFGNTKTPCKEYCM
jgi:hypothetical protein